MFSSCTAIFHIPGIGNPPKIGRLSPIVAHGNLPFSDLGALGQKWYPTHHELHWCDSAWWDHDQWGLLGDVGAEMKHSFVFFGGVIWLLASACRPTLSATRAAGSMEITSTACPTSRTLWAAPWPAKVPWFPIAKWDVFPWTLRAGTNPEKVLVFVWESIPDLPGLRLRNILSSVSFGGEVGWKLLASHLYCWQLCFSRCRGGWLLSDCLGGIVSCLYKYNLKCTWMMIDQRKCKMEIRKLVFEKARSFSSYCFAWLCFRDPFWSVQA